jgi:hypothetical protein
MIECGIEIIGKTFNRFGCILDFFLLFVNVLKVFRRIGKLNVFGVGVECNFFLVEMIEDSRVGTCQWVQKRK